MSMEEGLKNILCDARESVHQQHMKCENYIRESPTTAMLGAVAFGYCLHRLPVRAILVTKVRVLSALTPPALLLFGAAKLYDFLQKQSTNPNDTRD